MKKVFSILMIAVCIGMAAPAQAQIHLGVKGGVNLSKVHFLNSARNFKKDNFTGFFVGPMIECDLPLSGFDVDGSLMFAQRGIKYKDDEYSKHEVSVKQRGLDIPINLKYTFGMGRRGGGIYLAVGPDFFFDFAKNIKYTASESVSTKKRRSEVGVNIGVGLKLLGHVQVGANYNIPCSKTSKYYYGGYRTKTWQFSAAYLF